MHQRQKEFQSSPVPRDGCNLVRRQIDALVQGFNPHPSRGTGATLGAHPGSEGYMRFNPHPSRGTGATSERQRLEKLLEVSILTRPEGRVQLDCDNCKKVKERGFNPHPSRGTGATFPNCCLHRISFGFNPHPSRGTGATFFANYGFNASFGFNPHPSRGTGATLPSSQKERSEQVSILTRPEGRVQLCFK